MCEMEQLTKKLEARIIRAENLFNEAIRYTKDHTHPIRTDDRPYVILNKLSEKLTTLREEVMRSLGGFANDVADLSLRVEKHHHIQIQYRIEELEERQFELNEMLVKPAKKAKKVKKVKKPKNLKKPVKR
jgi:hypothetical protein